jgi:hypothetical protein
MISTWTRQFILATGFFTLMMAFVTTNMFVNEQKMVKKQLEDKKTFQVSHDLQKELLKDQII